MAVNFYLLREKGEMLAPLLHDPHLCGSWRSCRMNRDPWIQGAFSLKQPHSEAQVTSGIRAWTCTSLLNRLSCRHDSSASSQILVSAPHAGQGIDNDGLQVMNISIR